MELIRCDFCKKEINPSWPHKKVTCEGTFRTVAQYDIDRHFCNDDCIGKYYSRGLECTSTES